MRVQRKSACDASRRAIRAAIVPLAVVVFACAGPAAPARAQSDGHSEDVDAKSDAPVPNEKKHAADYDPSWHPNEKDGRPWTDFPVILRSGRAGSGRFSLGAGDSGGLEPLIDAQKRKSLIASAELDLYDRDSHALIGKYRIKGIQVLSLKDVQASACAMYEITMSFQSVQKI
jgi:hypothetical protein